MTDKGVEMRGVRDKGADTNKTRAHSGASSDTSRPSSCIRQGRRLEESLSHQDLEVLRQLEDLQVNFRRDRAAVT